MAELVSSGVVEIKEERSKLKRELTLLPLFGMMYFTVCGGAFGAEPMVGYTGPGMAILLLALTPLVYSIPNMLMVREMTSMMPIEGGYYHWVKAAFGPFWGFLTGWMNLVVSWVDVAIYPVWAAAYLAFFIPALDEGAMIGGVYLSAGVLQWVVALVMIWLIALLQTRGARLTGLFTDWVGVIMLVPLIIMSGFGIYNWIFNGSAQQLPFMAEGQTVFGAFSVGLFIAMWNYMGWELPSSAGSEIVNPRRTYPMAMALTLVAAIGTYMIPTLSGLYGGAGNDGKFHIWGIEETDGIGPYLAEYSITEDQIISWGSDPADEFGWEFPDIAAQIGITFNGGEDGALALILGSLVTVSAIFSMTGLFIGNSLSSSRVPFAMAEDGMMPKWLVKVHPKYGTPYVSIIVASLMFSILSLSTFAFLVVVDVFLNVLALLLQFLSLWKLRLSRPEVPRQKVPGGMGGLVLVTLGPVGIFILATVSQLQEEGLGTLWLAAAAIAAGAIIYTIMRKYIKPGVPDVNPWEGHLEEE
jgi:amino acid transporter